MSEVIVVGEGSLETLNDTSALIAIRVARIVKGDRVAPKLHIPVTSTRRCQITNNSPSVSAIWFLKHLPNGSLVFADSPKWQSCQPFINDYEVPVGKLPARWAYSSSIAPEDKLAYELAASLEAHSGRSPLVLLEIPEALEGPTAKTKSRIYKKLAQSQISNVRTIGKLGLIRMGDPAALSEVADPVTPLTSAPLQTNAIRGGKPTKLLYGAQGTIQTYSSYVAASISQIVESKGSTVSAVGLLVAPGVPNSEIRRSAARALRNIHTAKAVGYLAPLLYDNDYELRVEAIGGLACFANGVPVLDPAKPGGGMDLNKPGPYKTDETISHFAMGSSTISSREAFYLTYWRSWWNKYGASI
jgi:hypothetical protein